MIALPLTSDRLTIRMMRREHAASLVDYRNHPEVARFQDWEIPFSQLMAERLINEQAGLDGPRNDEWVQLAVEVDGRAIGDVAVGVHDHRRQATLGYSITPVEQGKGYGTEAVAAVITALFAVPGMHRVVATIDPENVASRRVLEKLGFRFEGRSVKSVFVRNEWVDDDRYALLASEHTDGITLDDRG
jgi:aminoglycoside 6'-N-acetyltransferase